MIKTHQPTFKPGEKLMVGYADFCNRNIIGYVSGPSPACLAGGLPASLEIWDGFRENTTFHAGKFGRCSEVLRSELVMEPTDWIRFAQIVSSLPESWSRDHPLDSLVYALSRAAYLSSSSRNPLVDLTELVRGFGVRGQLCEI
jgi:hypothetical protein